MRLCPDCKETRHGNFCDTCGCKLVDLPKCRACNKTIFPKDKFCDNCGLKVER